MDGPALKHLRNRFSLTQGDVARAAGMQQPDLSAIENGKRGTPETRARVLRAIRSLTRPSQALDTNTRRAIRAAIRARGGSEIRVFGSSARGADRPGSDLDIMARFPDDFDLLDLMELEDELEQLSGVSVDVVSDDPRTPYALAAARTEAVPL